MTDVSDADLLAQFARNNSEDAFTTLVERHLPLVHSVALRHTSNPQQAQDISQAVFVILARKAGALGCKTVLPGWLYHTARLTAANWQRTEVRRRRREQEAFMQSTLAEAEPDAVWHELSPLLDVAMGQLGARDRDALVLRYFQNQSLAAVGATLGVEERAAQKRVRRALEKLRKFFSKQGIALSTMAIAGTLSVNSVKAAPAELAKTVTAVAATKGVAASASTLTLIKGALKLMAWTKVKSTIVVGAVILMAAGGTTVAIHELRPRHLSVPGNFYPPVEKTPGFALTKGAVDFLHQLRIQGRLPGIQKNEQVNVMVPTGLTNADSYPVVRELHARKFNATGPFPYQYTVGKQSPTNDWELLKARHVDAEGNVEEFPVP